MLHAISVDVEDWFQSTIDARAALSDRFERSTAKVLEAFAAAGVRGTFFVLGLAAEKAPHVVRQIAEAGHEIQSHGYAHRLNYDLAPADFREDVVRARKLLEDLVGREVFGYRPPSSRSTNGTCGSWRSWLKRVTAMIRRSSL
jgi:peptidoglycan/xylan/chitin deacetylase (PgdA/CDA1 family)